MSITRQGPLDHLQLGAMSKPIFSSPPHMNLSMFQLWGVTTSSMYPAFIHITPHHTAAAMSVSVQ